MNTSRNILFIRTRHWVLLRSPQQWQKQRGKSLKSCVCGKVLAVQDLRASQEERREERLSRSDGHFGGCSIKIAPGGPHSKNRPAAKSRLECVLLALECLLLCSLGCGMTQVPGTLPQFFGWRYPFHGILHWRGEGKRDCFTNSTHGLRALS